MSYCPESMTLETISSVEGESCTVQRSKLEGRGNDIMECIKMNEITWN